MSGEDQAGSSPPAGAEGAGAPVLSLIIVAYKSAAFLEPCLNSIAAAGISLPWEVLVIDNAPADGACAQVCAGRAGVRYLPNQRNVGFGRACNQGMRLARGRTFLLVNPDIEILPGSVEALYQCLQDEPDAGLIAPRLDYPDGTLQESCRTFYTLPIFLLRRTFLGRLFPDSPVIRHHLLRDWDHASTRDVDWCMGASLMVRAEAADDVGLMDERFFMYFEDVDWCYRMHQRGWKVLYHPSSRMVHHYQRASAGWRPGKGLWWHLGSTVLYYEKWSFVLYWFKLRSRQLRQAALWLLDLALVALSFVLAYAARSLFRGVLTKPLFAFELYLRFFAFTLAVAMASLGAAGLYRERMRPSVIDNGLPVARALGWTSMLMMAATFLFSVRMYSRMMVLLFYPLAVLLVTLGRTGLLRLIDSVRRRDLNLRRVGLLGPAAAVTEALARLERFGRGGLEAVPLARAEGAVGEISTWLRRIQSERVSEVVLFEDWAGDVRGLLEGLRLRGVPVRLVPALRESLPAEGTYAEFLNWPSLLIQASPPQRSPGRRLGDLLLASAFGLLWLVPYLLAVLLRLLTGRPVWEKVALRGAGGLVLAPRRLAGTRPESGFAGTILHWYPALWEVVAGRMSLVGIYPFPDAEWSALDPAYRQRPPASPPGILGPWTGGRAAVSAMTRWNEQYSRQWSAAGDFRIFWRAVAGAREPAGGNR